MNNIAQIVYYGYDLLFDDMNVSDEEDDIEKIWGFAEETVPRFGDHQFKQNFCMSPSTFEKLLQLVHNIKIIEENNLHSGHPEISVEKQLMITVWCLGNVESFRSVGLKFGITKSTCWSVLYRTCKKLLQVSQQNGIISWPDRHRAIEISNEFEAISQFPGVIGAIDGCHIQINKPKEHPNSYINRKGYPSVLLQGVCDHRKLFTDVFTGVPGSMHDSRLYRISDLCHKIENDIIEFPNNTHMIGDLAYSLSDKLIVGFKNNGNLTNAQRNFNTKLSRARVVIEHAFGFLKGRFRRLKMLETVRQDLIALLIIPGCILHNVCILQEDLPEDYVALENQEIEEFDEEIIVRVRENINGRVKRDCGQLQNSFRNNFKNPVLHMFCVHFLKKSIL